MSDFNQNPVVNRTGSVPGATQGLIAGRPQKGPAPGDWYLALDQKMLYEWDGTTWQLALDGSGGGGGGNLIGTLTSGRYPVATTAHTLVDGRIANTPFGGGQVGIQGSGTNGKLYIGDSTTVLDPTQIFGMASSIAGLFKGMTVPIMTNTQRLSIASPIGGLLVYCTDGTNTVGFWYFDASVGQWLLINRNTGSISPNFYPVASSTGTFVNGRIENTSISPGQVSIVGSGNNGTLFVGDNELMDASQIFGLKSNISGAFKGMTAPIMSNAQRLSILSPIDGLLVYCLDGGVNRGFWNYDSALTAWVRLLNTTTGGTLEIVTTNGNTTDKSVGLLHLFGTSALPTISLGPGAGIGATSTNTGDDLGGFISVTTGVSGTVDTILTIQFSNIYDAIPTCVIISPANGNTAALVVNAIIVVAGNITNTSFDIVNDPSSGVALFRATTYSWFYFVKQ